MRILIVGLCMASAVALAEEHSHPWPDAPSGQDEIPVVLTPARLRQPQAQVPASVTVIDRELIEASGARELYQVLQLVPGMTALKVDGNVPTVSYHGTQARDVRRMLVLIDGRSQYQPGLARVLWNDFPVEIGDVERIEVTRGPAAAAYGANAFQGVINIVTRHPAEVAGTTLATRTGNNGVADWRLTTGSHSEVASTRVTLASRRDDGYDGTYFDTSADVEDFVARRDRKHVETLNLRSAFQSGEDDSLELMLGGSRSRLERTGVDSDFHTGMAFTEGPDEVSEQAFAQAVWEHRFSPAHQLKTQLYAQHTSGALELEGCLRLGPDQVPDAGGAVFLSREMRELFEFYDGDFDETLEAFESAGPGTQPVYDRLAVLYGAGAGPLCTGFELDIQERRYDLELQHTWLANAATRLVTGANLRLDRVKSDTYLGEVRENFSRRFFGNLELRLAPPLLLDLGGYWEEDDLNGSFFSPRSALIYNFLPSHGLRAVYAKTVRTPDIYEEKVDVHLVPERLPEPYASDPGGLLGWASPELFPAQKSDGSLDPEEITSRELGYYGQWRTLEWDLRYFREELRSLFSAGMNPFVFRPDNDGKVDIEGREAQVTWRVTPAHLLRATGSHLHTESRHPRSSTRATELRLAPRDSATLLWAWQLSRAWMFSLAGYLAHHYNDVGDNATTYERADAQLVWRTRAGDSDVRVSALYQRDLTEDPVVFEDNVYEDNRRYWISASVTF